MTTHLRRTCRALAAAALGAALLAVAPAAASAQTGGFPSVGTNFGQDGPYDVATQTGPQHTYFYPRQIQSTGLQHPVILWGNGTGAAPTAYDELLPHLASHGFIVAAANTPNAGSGTEMLAGLDNLTRFDATPSSPFHQAVAEDLVATTGHSQGGAGALAAARDPRVDTAFPIEGAFSSTGVRGPILFIAGEDDTIARPDRIRSTFQSAAAPSAYAEIAGADHFAPARDSEWFEAIGVAWARWHLMGDQAARSWFVGANCGLCNIPQVSDYAVNAQFRSAFGGGTGEPPPPPPPGGDCVSASTRSHVAADRATSFFGFARAVGSRDFLGRVSSFGSVSLRQTAPGTWSEVPSC